MTRSTSTTGLTRICATICLAILTASLAGCLDHRTVDPVTPLRLTADTSAKVSAWNATEGEWVDVGRQRLYAGQVVFWYKTPGDRQEASDAVD